MDLAPPGTSAVGIHALLFTLVGMATYAWARLTARTVVAVVAWAGAMAALVVVGRGLLMVLTSDLAWNTADVLGRALTGAIYAAVLTPPMVVVVTTLGRGSGRDRRVVVGDRDAGSAASYRG